MKYATHLILLSFDLAIMNTGALNPAALVTGSTDGIGLTTAKNLAKLGYDILIHGRESSRIGKAFRTIRSVGQSGTSGGDRIFSLPPADLSSIENCRRVAADVATLCDEQDIELSVLMNNAGVFSSKHVLTDDGLELTFAVNVVAPFVLTSLLLPILLKRKSRIVIASSISQCSKIRDWNDMEYKHRSYNSHAAYSESKLLDAMLTMEMAARLQDAGFGINRITANCLDPGTVNTKMLLDGWGPIGMNVDDALGETWLCSSPDVDDTTGKYFIGRSERQASASAYDLKERQIMWDRLSAVAPDAAEMWKFDWL